VEWVKHILQGCACIGTSTISCNAGLLPQASPQGLGRLAVPRNVAHEQRRCSLPVLTNKSVAAVLLPAGMLRNTTCQMWSGSWE
jgi:hypothetical protein